MLKDCVAESQEYLHHIVATSGAKLVERIAEDYGLSQKDLLERFVFTSLCLSSTFPRRERRSSKKHESAFRFLPLRARPPDLLLALPSLATKS